MSTTESLRIHKLEAENFKRIEVLSIDFPQGGGSFEFAGANEAGKSSAIDALSAAILGKDAAPAKPLRNGSLAGSVSVILGDPGSPDAIKVTRQWRADGESRLVVTDADGSRVTSPQTKLDKLWSHISFDPLEFDRMTSSKQAEVLRQVAGLDFTDLRRQYALTEDKRKEAGRELKTVEARVKTLPPVEPTEPVELKEFQRRLQEANAANAERARSVAEYDRQVAKAAELKARAERLQAEWVAAEELLAQTKPILEAAAARIGPAVDTDSILHMMDQANEINEQARKYRERANWLAKLDEALTTYNSHDATLKGIVAERSRLLAEASFPVQGLSIDNDVVTLRGIPFADVSSSERIITSMCIAAALNPKLRVAIIKDGSLLDDTNLTLVNAWAQANDYQVFIERVAKSTHGAGVVIEAGRVKSLSAAGASS